ncbi:MAG: 23S rRNA (pseudouridine(1915)-N(3))-methyltransferase RlmH [Gemmatimonadota bacterium]|nr:23S rRNA (pseudouridine(1915)-N(3))-methyltransferase RlmH [Gemmatimonadota bacterium]
MKISVVVVGRAGSLGSAIREYEARAARYWRLEVVEVRQGRGSVADDVMRREAGNIRARLRRGFDRVAVTREGRRFSSAELARWLEGVARTPAKGVHFLVGGAFGLDPDLKEECGLRLSLSSFTLPHDFARLVLAEQLYRAGTILGNQPYHKGSR